MRKKISSTLLIFSATAFALLLLASPLALFNLVPVQAQTTTTTLSFRTTQPASGGSGCAGTTDATLTLQGQGTLDSDNSKHGKITGGTFQIINSSSSSDGQILYSGSIQSGQYFNESSGGNLDLESTLEHVSNTDVVI